MQRNGFHLNKQELVQSEKPHILGIIGEVFSVFIGSFIAILYISSGMNEFPEAE